MSINSPAYLRGTWLKTKKSRITELQFTVFLEKLKNCFDFVLCNEMQAVCTQGETLGTRLVCTMLCWVSFLTGWVSDRKNYFYVTNLTQTTLFLH
jgi:hypothetical protein